MIRRFIASAALCAAAFGVASAQTPSVTDVRDLLRKRDSAASTSALPDAVRRAFSDLTPREAAEVENGPTTLLEGPVDAESYHLGPGDELTLYYRGKTAMTERMVVTPEGLVYISDTGGLDVGGKTLAAARKEIRDRVGRVLRDVSVDVQLTGVRAFKISVGGAVRRPGVYKANGATRLFELVRMAGGITDSAAVRDIRILDRDGGVVRSVDLLPFLLGAAAAGSNPTVSDGWTVFVPPRGRTVTVLGAVAFPGEYDLPAGETTAGRLLDLLQPTSDAALDRIQVGRLRTGDAASFRTESREALDGETVIDDMAILVPAVRAESVARVARVDGEVVYPGPYGVPAGGMTLRELVTAAGGFTQDAVPARVRLARPLPGDTLAAPVRRLLGFGNVPLTATEKEILRSRGVDGWRAVVVDLGSGGDGPTIEPGDQVFVPRDGGWVEVTGRVRSPGFYPYRDGWSARDYVTAAGGWADRADKGQMRVGGAPGDNFRTAKDAGSPEPGDQVWVPEKNPRNTLEVARDFFLIIAQVATVVLVIDQVTRN